MFLLSPYSSVWRLGPKYHLEQSIVCPWGRGGLEYLWLYLLNFALWQLSYGIRALSRTPLEGLGNVWRFLDQLSFPPSQPTGKALSKSPYSYWFPFLGQTYLLLQQEVQVLGIFEIWKSRRGSGNQDWGSGSVMNSLVTMDKACTLSYSQFSSMLNTDTKLKPFIFQMIVFIRPPRKPA